MITHIVISVTIPYGPTLQTFCRNLYRSLFSVHTFIIGHAIIVYKYRLQISPFLFSLARVSLACENWNIIAAGHFRGNNFNISICISHRENVFTGKSFLSTFASSCRCDPVGTIHSLIVHTNTVIHDHQRRKKHHNWGVPLHVTHAMKAILTLRHACNAYRFHPVLTLQTPLNTVKKQIAKILWNVQFETFNLKRSQISENRRTYLALFPPLNLRFYVTHARYTEWGSNLNSTWIPTQYEGRR